MPARPLRRHRDGPLGSVVRACANLVDALADLVRALTARLTDPAPRRGAGAPPAPVERAALRLAPDALLEALRNLGFRDREVAEMCRTAEGRTLEERVRSALSRRSA